MSAENDLPTLQLSAKARTGLGKALGEFIATFGLILTILGTGRFRREWVAPAVALYIVAAYWFTSSTSFANPAITVARSLTNTFAGIAPQDIRCSSLLGGLRGTAGEGPIQFALMSAMGRRQTFAGV